MAAANLAGSKFGLALDVRDLWEELLRFIVVFITAPLPRIYASGPWTRSIAGHQHQ